MYRNCMKHQPSCCNSGVKMVPLLLLFMALCAVVFVAVSLQRKCPPCADRGVSCPVVPVQDPAPQVVRECDVRSRDLAVLNDPLFPPWNRQSASQHDAYRRALWLRSRAVTRDDDAFRLVAYLVRADDSKEAWKLFGRKRDNNTADFYLMSTKRDDDVKVPVSRSTMPDARARLRGLDDLPDRVVFATPIVDGTFDVMQLPNTDFATDYV